MVPQYVPFCGVQVIAVHVPESGSAPHTLGMPPPPHD
jgi:hypothetical protein